MKKLTNKKGFTLVELLVVVAIIAILMLIALPRMLDSTKGAKIRTFEANARTLISTANISVANNGGGIANVDADLSDQIKQLGNKPADSGYAYGTGTNKVGTVTAAADTLVCELKLSDTANDIYRITYSPKTGIISQTYKGQPISASNKLSGYTDLSNGKK